MEHGDPTCQIISGGVIDEKVGKLLKEAMTPMAIEVSLEVEKKVQDDYEQQHKEAQKTLDEAKQKRFSL